MIRIKDYPTNLGVTYGEFVHTLFRKMEPAAMLAHAGMGVITELFEAATATDDINELEEVGDIVFFCEAYRQCLPVQADEAPVLPEYNSDDALMEGAMHMLDAAKRWLAYGRAPTDDVSRKLSHAAELLAMACIRDCSDAAYDESLQAVINANVAKLQVRYPKGFSTQAAVQRDTNAERDAVHGA